MAREYQLKRKKENFVGASNIHYAQELNEQQLSAVVSAPGPALVIAGAGSGKTRTLTYRVAYLLDQGIDPRNILLLTFTNKAAREMLDRVRELVPTDISDLWGGTFHSIANRMLRRHADDLGYNPSFSILDRDDQKTILKKLVNGLDLKSKAKRFPKPELLASIFSLAVNTQLSIEQVLDQSFPYHLEFSNDIKALFVGYSERKKEMNTMDFDDLLVKVVELLRDHVDLRDLYARKFQFVLVDEYQDTNSLQSEWIDLLVSKHRSLMVVGDDAQSIYSWRGADMDHILSFEERYPGAKIYKIETNYRSVPEILELSNEAIRGNSRQYEKTLVSSRKQAMIKPALVPVHDPKMQAEFVAQRIQELVEDEGLGYEDIAVLYRAHYQSMEMQMELTQASIPYQITSGIRFFEQAHIKDVLSFIKIVVNPTDEVSFTRVLCLLPGVADKGAQKIWQKWHKDQVSQRVESGESYVDLMDKFTIPTKAKDSWKQFSYTLDELRQGNQLSKPTEMLKSIIEGAYDDYLRASFDNYEQRLADLEQLCSFAESYDDVEEFLSQMSLLSNTDSKENKEEKESPSITLSSIHQAKGLEWKAVFVIGLCEGMFPSRKVLESEDIDAIEEERRLFYVAITRARDFLHLVYPQLNPKSYSGDFYLLPSRFLSECPSRLVDEWKVC